MSDNEKAAHILAYLARMYRPAAFLEVENVLNKCSSNELDYYFRFCCCPLE